jgi:hypothetical protein
VTYVLYGWWLIGSTIKRRRFLTRGALVHRDSPLRPLPIVRANYWRARPVAC